jgi:hypothetical protein
VFVPENANLVAKGKDIEPQISMGAKGRYDRKEDGESDLSIPARVF